MPVVPRRLLPRDMELMDVIYEMRHQFERLELKIEELEARLDDIQYDKDICLRIPAISHCGSKADQITDEEVQEALETIAKIKEVGFK